MRTATRWWVTGLVATLAGPWAAPGERPGLGAQEPPANEAGTISARWPELIATHRDLLQRTGIVGSSLAVVADGRIVARSDQGFQDLERRRPVDANTIYHWASITKTLTGIAIMQLRDRGRLRLDDPVVDYVPEIRAIHNPHGDMAQLTIRHLLSHSSGLRASTWPWGGGEPW